MSLLERKWPKELGPEAYHGISGDFLRLVGPNTEADVIALLIQFLAAFGNMVGRSAYLEIEADKHYPNLFTVVVGDSSKGRKGTSLGYIRKIFSAANDNWWSNCQVSGLSSGEGLVWPLRESEESDTVVDKRRLVVETEFGAVLEQFKRQGNILSATLRDAWDHGDFNVLTKKDPLKVKGAHISVIGHITREELEQKLSMNEVFNGLGNRFIWVISKRSKLIPLGGKVDQTAIASISGKISNIYESLSNIGAVHLSEDAMEFYSDLYYQLSEEKCGGVGAILSRAEPIILRLALIYALLDGRRQIDVEHLRSATAIWEYAEQSVEYIFGEKLGDKRVSKLLNALQSSRHGLTITEIYKVFSNHISREDLLSMLDRLKNKGLVDLDTVTSKWKLLSAN